jgi:hypothetical protein
MARSSDACAGRVVVLLVLLAAPVDALADMGPTFEKPRAIVQFRRRGEPIAPERFEVVLLKPESADDQRPDKWSSWEDRFAWLKSMDRAAFTDRDGTSWVPSWEHGGRAIPDSSHCQVIFLFRSTREPVPPRVRLALYLREEQRVVLTNPAPTRTYISNLTLEIAPDGSASLQERPVNPVKEVLGVLEDNISSLVYALLATVPVELLIVIVCGLIRKGTPIGRLSGAVVLGNLITVPLVWIVSVYAKVETPTMAWGSPFYLAEIAAIFFEGWLYNRIARVPFGMALLWSLIANAVTFLIGCGMIAFTV